MKTFYEIMNYEVLFIKVKYVALPLITIWGLGLFFGE